MTNVVSLDGEQFMRRNLAESGLTSDDFNLVPGNAAPAIQTFTETVQSKTAFAGMTVYGYSIAYPTPMHNGYISGFSVKRFANHPDHKYEGPSGVQHLYWSTSYDRWLKSKTKFIVEGEKKALAFVKYLQATAVGIRGCWGFSRDNDIVMELKESVREGDRVWVCMDGDFVTHPDIKKAAGTLARQIHLLGAEPVFVVFPYSVNGKRMGADDWIMSQQDKSVEALRDAFDDLPIYDWRELPEAPSFMTRRLRLAVDAKGNAIKNEDNTSVIMEDLWGRESLFTDQYKGAMFSPRGRTDPPQNYTDETFDSVLFRYFERVFGIWSKEAFRSVRRAMIGTNRRNLLGERLQSIVWDGHPRIENAMVNYWGAVDTPYARKVSKGTFLGGIARCMFPGTKWDHVLILEGEQRKGKSYSLQVITYGYYVNVKMGDSADSISRKSCSAWCVNCDELDHMTKGNREAFKSWVSETHENWVPKYIEYARETPRPFFITGTTNETVYLNDPTGGERFWPIRVAQTRDKVDVAGLERDRDQLWAEAWHILQQSPADWWREFENDATGAAIEQASREHDDPLTEVLAAAIATSRQPRAVVKDGPSRSISVRFVTMHWMMQVAMNANLPTAKRTQAAVCDAAKRLRLEHVQFYDSQLDQASLEATCRDSSNVTVRYDQFPNGHVRKRIWVYTLRVDFDEEHG